MAGVELLHVPPGVILLRVVVFVWHNAVVPVIAGKTVTVIVVDEVQPDEVV